MELLGKLSEDEMVAEFLRGEYSSERFGGEVAKLLKEHGASPELVAHPNLADDSENSLRKALLGAHRGYGKNEKIFKNFPEDTQWYRAAFAANDLREAKYIRDDYWVELSGGTRLAVDAAKNVLAGKVVFDQSNQQFLDLAEEIRKGTKFPRLVFVAKDKDSPVVVLEGHVRLTAYMLTPESIPEGMEVIIGYSKNMVNWGLY